MPSRAAKPGKGKAMENRYGTYTHKETGSVGTKEDFVFAYTIEELEKRGLTPEEAFKEDVGKTLFEASGV